MVHLEIIESPDQNVLTSFQFFKNEIYLGYSFGNLFIKDSLLLPSHLMIEVVEKDLIVHPQKNVESYLIEGKRASTPRKIKVGQIISIGQTKFKIIAFEETIIKTKKNILDEKLGTFVEGNSSRLTVIEKLARMMK